MPDLPHATLDPAIDALAHALAERRGVAPLEAVRQALEEALDRAKPIVQQGPIPDLPEKLRGLAEKYKDVVPPTLQGAGNDITLRLHEWAEKYRDAPILDDRTADEIIGYNEHGVWD